MNEFFSLIKYNDLFDAVILTAKAKKTQYTIFNRKQRATPHTNLKLINDRNVLEKCTRQSFLVVTLECNFSRKDRNVTNK